MDAPIPRHAAAHARLASAFALLLLAAGTARACDGKSYSFDLAVGQAVSAGGLAVQLDRIKLLEKDPDKYIVSVKDDDTILADHALLVQYNTLSYKTRCGTVTIGADRKSMFHHSTLTINWSYF